MNSSQLFVPVVGAFAHLQRMLTSVPELAERLYKINSPLNFQFEQDSSKEKIIKVEVEIGGEIHLIYEDTCFDIYGLPRESNRGCLVHFSTLPN